MTTMRDALRRALVRGDAVALGRLCDLLRFRHGVDHAGFVAMCRRARPETTEAEVDALLHEADEEESHG